MSNTESIRINDALISLEGRITKVEREIANLREDEERKGDREIVEKIVKLKEYINNEIATLSTTFNLSLQEEVSSIK